MHGNGRARKGSACRIRLIGCAALGKKQELIVEGAVETASTLAAGMLAAKYPELALAIYGGQQVLNAAAKGAVARVGDLLLRRSSRVDELFRRILEGVPEDEMGEVLRSLETADARATVEKIVDDMLEDREDEKVPLYARLLLHLTLRGQQKPKERRGNLVRTLRNLAVADIEMLLRLERNIREMREARQARGNSFTQEDAGKLIGQVVNGGNEMEKLACRHLLNEHVIMEGAHRELSGLAMELVEALTS